MTPLEQDRKTAAAFVETLGLPPGVIGDRHGELAVKVLSTYRIARQKELVGALESIAHDAAKAFPGACGEQFLLAIVKAVGQTASNALSNVRDEEA